MAEDVGYDAANRGEMDYPEHERTYERFLGLVKYGTIGVIAILIGMLMGLIVGAGVIMSVFCALVFGVVAYVLMKTGDEKSMKH